MMNKMIVSVLAVVAIVATAVVQGRWTDRWSSEPAKQIQQFVESFDDVATRIVVGDREWRGSEPEEDAQKKARVEERTGANKIRTIAYTEVESGQAITVSMVCGPSRDVSNHTPNACYVSAGYKMIEPITKYKIGPGVFYTSVFQRDGNDLRIFWSWNPAGKFEVPAGKPPGDPRRKYGGRLPLNKVYLVNRMSSKGQKPGESPCVTFGAEFIKAFNKAVFESNAASDAAVASDGEASSSPAKS